MDVDDVLPQTGLGTRSAGDEAAMPAGATAPPHDESDRVVDGTGLRAGTRVCGVPVVL